MLQFVVPDSFSHVMSRTLVKVKEATQSYLSYVLEGEFFCTEGCLVVGSEDQGE